MSEEDFPEVVDALRAGYAADRLPRPLRDDVVRTLDRRKALKRVEWTAQIAAATLVAVGLALVIAWPRAATLPAAQASDEQRLSDLRLEIDRVRDEIRALKEEITRLESPPPPPKPVPLPVFRITAVASEIGLVVLSGGSEQGVIQGAKYVVHRDGRFVAQLVVDRVDRTWSAAKVVLQSLAPKVADVVEVAP